MNTELVRLEKISNIARILSWIVLAIHVLYAAWAILLEIQGGMLFARDNLLSFFPYLVMLASAATSFVILQAIYLGASVLIEIQKTTED